MVKGKLIENINKDLTLLPCGYKIIGNPKKKILLKRLHLSKCEKCKLLQPLVDEGKMSFIGPDLSYDPKFKYYMKRGYTSYTASKKVFKEREDETSKLRNEGDNKLSIIDLLQKVNNQ